MTDEAFGLYRALMDASAAFTRERMDCQRREHSRDGCMSFAKDIAYAPSFFCVSPLRPKISSLPWCRWKGRHKARAGSDRKRSCRLAFFGPCGKSRFANVILRFKAISARIGRWKIGSTRRGQREKGVDCETV